MAKRRNPAAVELGRRGGLKASGKGGRVYWAQFTPEERAAMMAAVRAKRRTRKK
jgi:hypothetical protein